MNVPVETLFQIKSLEELNCVLKKYDYVIVDYSAKWCAPCRNIIPKLLDFQHLYKMKGVFFVKIDVEDDFNDYHGKIPFFKLYKKNILVDTLIGAEHEILLEKIQKMVQN